MGRSDVAAVAGIARASFPVPWGASAFLDELKRDFAVIRVLRPQHGAPVCGFVHLWHVADEAQVMNVAILPAYRRRGFAGVLMRDAVSRSRGWRCRLMTLEVRRSNESAILLYEKFGFGRIGIRQGYYSDDGEDALVMHLRLDGTPDQAPDQGG